MPAERSALADALRLALDAGDPSACVAAFEGVSDADRRRLHGAAKKAFKDFDTTFAEVEPGTYRAVSNYSDAQRETTRVALLATASAGDMRKLGWRSAPVDLDLAIEVVRRLSPPWLEDWAEMLAADTPLSWQLSRRLVREGLSRKPTSDGYILGMLTPRFLIHHSAPLLDSVLADPDLLEDEVWRLFEVEGGGENSLAAHDKYTQDIRSWHGLLLAFSAEGRLDRNRLLDASLDALGRDFAHFRAGWFSRFHEALTPTVDERAARAPRYLTLLASSIPPTVSFALAAVGILDKFGLIAPSEIVAHVEPVLHSKAKATVMHALKLLASAAKRDASVSCDVARLVANALAHEASDVQKAALDLIDAIGRIDDADLVAAIRGRAGGVAASLQPRLIRWSIATPLVSDTSIEHQEPTSSSAATRSRLDPAMAITPIANLDELLDRFAFVVENAGETAEIERVLGGVSSLCADSASDFAARIAPLHKRATTKLATTSPHEHPIDSELCRLAIAWATRAVVEPGLVDAYGRTLMSFFVARVSALVHRVSSQQALPLLSLPTHTGSWIAPSVLAARLRAWQDAGATPDPHDRVLAFLRLAPEGRNEALRATRDLEGEQGMAMRHALGARGESIGPSAALWIAAARARIPDEDDAAVESRHPDLGPDAGRSARLGWRVATTKSPTGPYIFYSIAIDRDPPQPEHVRLEHLAVIMHQRGEYTGAAGSFESTVRWACSIWPARREALFAEAAQNLGRNLDWSSAEWQDRAYLEPLLDPHTVMTPMATLLLALALAAKEPGLHGLATDAFIATTEEGRLDAPRLGATMARLLGTGLIKASRWASTLGEVARVSPRHARVVCEVTQGALRGDPAEAPRDLGTLLEMLHERMVELHAPIVDVDARVYLEACVGRGGKTGKLARAIVALG